jgi:hypothetical protein
VFGATSAIDSHYAVIGAMGDRFLLTRLAPVAKGQFDRALQHVGSATTEMRKQLAEAVARLFAGRRADPTLAARYNWGLGGSGSGKNSPGNARCFPHAAQARR